jgi:hypothetical protein
MNLNNGTMIDALYYSNKRKCLMNYFDKYNLESYH